MSLVEYHDPDGLFPVVLERLRPRLPLKGLSWTSSSGSVYSAESLPLTFAPASRNKSNAESESNPAIGAGHGDATARRHQLPGLQQTPLLRIYVLRCDDKDQYKSVKQNAIRRWLDDHATSLTGPRKGQQTGHDACEWLILHVILPGTTAASEPRWVRNSSSDLDVSKKDQSVGTRWSGKASRSIIEQLRTDFENQGSSTQTRIAQLRLRKDELPLDVGPELPIPRGHGDGETAKEGDLASSDVLDNLKSRIVASFDARLKQYETDIAEKLSQRSLPGWNFCTFFILKEGLAQSFERIGLLSDALRSYEELHADLDSLIDGELYEQQQTHGTTFSTCPNDLAVILGALVQRSEPGSELDISVLEYPLDCTRKNFRVLIAANSISAFDFKCYVFSCQLRLSTCMGRPYTQDSARSMGDTAKIQSTKTTNNNVEEVNFKDVAALANVCKLAGAGLPVLSRLLRRDLCQCNLGSDFHNDSMRSAAVDAIVASWTFAAAQQAFDSTKSSHFDEVRSHYLTNSVSATPFAAQKTLHTSSSANGNLQNAQSRLYSSSAGAKSELALGRSGLFQAASCRAEICLMQRQMLKKATGWHSWSSHRDGTLSPAQAEQEPHSSLDGDGAIEKASVPAISQMLEKTTLLQSTESFSAFTHHFEVGELKQSVPSGLKNLKRKDEYVRVALALIAKRAEHQPSAENLPEAGQRKELELRESPTGSSELLKNILTFARELPCEVEVPLQEHFLVTSLDQNITLLDDEDGFSLMLNIEPLAHAAWPVDKIALHLSRDEQAEGHHIILRSDISHTVRKPSAGVELRSRTTATGPYRPWKLTLHVGQVTFVLETASRAQSSSIFKQPTQATDRSIILGRIAQVFCFPHSRAFDAQLRLSKTLRIGSKRLIELILSCGQNCVQSVNMTVKSHTAGLRLHTAQASSSRETLHIDPGGTPGTLSWQNLASSLVQISIPIDVDHNSKRLTVSLELEYETSNGTFSLLKSFCVSTRVPLDVNVQDALRLETLQSKLLIMPGDEGPRSIASVKLEGNNYWSIDAVSPSQRLTALADRPSFMAYNTAPIATPSSNFDPSANVLQLCVQHISILDCILHKVKGLLTEAMERSKLRKFQSLLQMVLAENIHNYTPRDVLEYSALTEEFELPPFSSFDWSKVFNAVSPSEANEISEWLQRWHSHNDVLILSAQLETSEPEVLIVPFEIPSVDALHSASVTLVETQIPPVFTLQHKTILVGSAHTCHVSIHSTFHWSRNHSWLSSEEEKLFQYSLNYDASMWMVAGPVQSTFAASEGAEKAAEFTLTPLRRGFAALPTVDIVPFASLCDGLVVGGGNSSPFSVNDSSPSARNFSPHDGIMSTSRPSLQPDASITCETDCTTAGHGVWVIDGADTSTIHI
ncbi:MAG: hypothetical protein Q9162_007793 [Coniocarpon cinnabarinum]